MGDFGGVYLVKFIHLRAFYMTFEDVHGRRTDAGRRTDNGRCIDVPLLRNGRLIILNTFIAEYYCGCLNLKYICI